VGTISQIINGTPERVADRFLSEFKAAIPANADTSMTAGADGSEVIEFVLTSPLPRMVAHHRLTVEPPAADGSRTIRFEERIEGRRPLAGTWKGHTTFTPEGEATLSTIVVDETTFGGVIRRLGEGKLRSGLRSLARGFEPADVGRELAN
jgi:hypothetical protein